MPAWATLAGRWNTSTAAAHDRDLAAALRRDRAAEWGPGGSID